MVLRKGISKKDMEKVIEKGGAGKKEDKEKPVRFVLTISRKLSDMIDEKISQRMDKVTRHRFVIEAIMKKLEMK